MAMKNPKKPASKQPNKEVQKVTEAQAGSSWTADLSNSDWPKKFRDTFDLWQRLDPHLYKGLLYPD